MNPHRVLSRNHGLPPIAVLSMTAGEGERCYFFIPGLPGSIHPHFLRNHLSFMDKSPA